MNESGLKDEGEWRIGFVIVGLGIFLCQNKKWQILKLSGIAEEVGPSREGEKGLGEVENNSTTWALPFGICLNIN